MRIYLLRRPPVDGVRVKTNCFVAHSFQPDIVKQAGSVKGGFCARAVLKLRPGRAQPRTAP